MCARSVARRQRQKCADGGGLSRWTATCGCLDGRAPPRVVHNQQKTALSNVMGGDQTASKRTWRFGVGAHARRACWQASSGPNGR